MFGLESLLQPKAKAFSRLAEKKSVPQQATNYLTSKTPEVLGEKVAKRAIEQLNAKSPKGGKFPVVLGPTLLAFLCMRRLGI